MKKILIVYYSWSGKSKTISYDIQKKVDADIEEITDKRNRKSFIGIMNLMSKKLTEIEPVKSKLNDYQLIIIVTPVFSNRAAPAVRTFIDRYRKQLRKTACFIVSSYSDPQIVIKNMQTLLGESFLEGAGVLLKDYKTGAKNDIIIKDFTAKILNRVTSDVSI